MKNVKRQAKKAKQLKPELTARELIRFMDAADEANQTYNLADERVTRASVSLAKITEEYNSACAEEEYCRIKAEKCWFNTRKFVVLRIEAEKRIEAAFKEKLRAKDELAAAKKSRDAALSAQELAHGAIPEEFYKCIEWKNQ